MTAGGQASVEYAGLLGLAAILGATLALVAGPPLLGAVRDAFIAALSLAARGPARVTTSAADIADVQSALLPGEEALTPDAAMVALRSRHGAEQAGEVADAVILSAALAAAPWLGASRTYRAWERYDDGPYDPTGSTAGERDVETPTGPPVVTWITVEQQRHAVAAALAHGPNLAGLALDVLSLIPESSLVRLVEGVGARPIEKVAVTGGRDSIDTARKAVDAVKIVESDDGDLPPGMRSGDVVVAWPVQRTAWRDGRRDPSARLDVNGLGTVRLPRDYVHLVFLRPGAHGLAVVAQGFGA